MKHTRKKSEAKLRAKAAIDALKERETLNELGLFFLTGKRHCGKFAERL